MRRTIRPSDPSFFDYQNHVDALSRCPTALDRLNTFIDWEAFRPHLRRALPSQKKDKGGRPSYDEVFLFKILVLQRIHGLSEESTELAVKDRLSWQRFLAIHLGCAFPDKNTIWSFKQRLIVNGAMESCFAAFFAQIEAHGVRLESGKIVDATIVEVPKQRNGREENEQIKQGKVPSAWEKQPAKLRQKDVDARWTRKHGTNFFGYKNHIKVDQKTKIIEVCVATPANAHDSTVVEDLAEKGDGRWYGDSAYHSAAINECLVNNDIQDWTIQPARRNRPLSLKQNERNRTKSRIRSRVEHVFGTMQTSLGGKVQRCVGFVRNSAMITFTNLVYNMDRLRYLVVST
jgi:IS5 family transposase